MAKCILCEQTIKDNSPYSNYCSQTCKEKGERYGEEKGRKKGLGCLATILIIIAGISFNGIKECSSGKKQILKENKVIEIDSQNSTNQTKEAKNISNKNIINKKGTNSQIDIKQENLSNNSSNNSKSNQELSEQEDSLNKKNATNSKPLRMKEYEKRQDEIKKATEMLKLDKSIDEIEESTTLTRKEIRQLRRKLLNEE